MTSYKKKEKDAIDKLFNQYMQTSHNKPSPETLEKFNKIDILMTKLEGGMERIEQKIEDHCVQQEKDITRIEKTVEEFINSADCKFAVKEVETDLKNLKERLAKKDYEWLKWLVGFICLLLAQILIKKLGI